MSTNDISDISEEKIALEAARIADKKARAKARRQALTAERNALKGVRMSANAKPLIAPAGSVITVELTDTVVEYIRAGNYISVSAQAAGIPDRRYRSWTARGKIAHDLLESGVEPEPDELIFADFYERTQKARAMAEAESVMRMRELASGRLRNINKATGKYDPKSWRQVDDRIRLQAETFFLERSFPDRWNPRVDVKQEVTGTIDTTVTLRLALPVPKGMQDLAKLTELETLGTKDDEGEDGTKNGASE